MKGLPPSSEQQFGQETSGMVPTRCKTIASSNARPRKHAAHGLLARNDRIRLTSYYTASRPRAVIDDTRVCFLVTTMLYL